MDTYHFFDSTTGVIDPGRRFTGTPDDAQLNAPDGHAPIAGVVDALSQAVDLVTGDLIDYQPPAPAATEWETWAWNATIKRWVPTPTEAAVARDLRVQRDALLDQSDWVVLRAIEQGQAVPTAWATYRQELRDLPAQATFPSGVDWPEAPAV